MPAVRMSETFAQDLVYAADFAGIKGLMQYKFRVVFPFTFQPMANRQRLIVDQSQMRQECLGYVVDSLCE